MSRVRHSVARAVHPVAWWLWAVALAVAAARADDVLVLLLVAAVAVWVTVERGEPGGLTILAGFFVIGVVALVLRLVMTVLLGGGVVEGPVVLSLPELRLPAWAGRLRLGGDVTRGALTASLIEATRLAVMLLCLGAANALAGPRRLLRHVPATLYDVGTALVVALSYAPELVRDAGRVRVARSLRGGSGRGLREVGTMALPVVAGALERSLQLAASMESRGYGRAGRGGVRRQRRATWCSVAGIVGVCVGVFGLLDARTPVAVAAPLVGAGLVLAVGALALGGASDRRTPHRPDPWQTPETVVVALGVLAALAVGATAGDGVTPGSTIHVLVVGATLLAGLAGVLTPPRPASQDRARAMASVAR